MKNNLTKYNLKGSIKTLTETDFIGTIIAGKYQKLDIEDNCIFDYNNKGNLIEKKGFISFGSKYKSIIEYDNNDNIISEKLYNLNGGLDDKSIYKYDDNGNLIENTLYSYNSDGSLYGYYISKYNAMGNIFEVNAYNSVGAFSFKSLSEFDEKGNRIEYNSFNSEGHLAKKYTFKYDANNNEIEEYQYKSNGILYEKQIFKYDDLNNKIEANTFNSDGSLKVQLIYIYEFDRIGNWIKRNSIENGIQTKSTEREIIYYRNKDIDKLYQTIIDGIAELECKYKVLSNEGKLEVMIFNSLLVYRIYRQNHPDKYSSIEMSLYESILNQTNIYQIELSQERLINFINARFQFYSQEIEKTYHFKESCYFPGKIYSAFYITPLSSDPEWYHDLGEVVPFYLQLTAIINFIKSNANKI